MLLGAAVLAMLWTLRIVATHQDRYWSPLTLTGLGLPWLYLDVPFLLDLTFSGVHTATVTAADTGLIAATAITLYPRAPRHHYRRRPPRQKPTWISRATVPQ